MSAMKARAMKAQRNKDCAMKALVTERKGLDRQALIPCWKKEPVFLVSFIDVNNRIYTRRFLRILLYFRTRFHSYFLGLDYLPYI